MDPRASLDAVAQRKIHASAEDLTTIIQLCSLVTLLTELPRFIILQLISSVAYATAIQEHGNGCTASRNR
jgi:hypothetical protein